MEKAKKLLDHALKLAPTHADVLTEYGYFVEKYHKDFVSAENMYTKALTYSPWHEGAIKYVMKHLNVVAQELLNWPLSGKLVTYSFNIYREI